MMHTCMTSIPSPWTVRLDFLHLMGGDQKLFYNQFLLPIHSLSLSLARLANTTQILQLVLRYCRCGLFRHMHLLQNQQETMCSNLRYCILKYRYKIDHTHIYGWVRGSMINYTLRAHGVTKDRESSHKRQPRKRRRALLLLCLI